MAAGSSPPAWRTAAVAICLLPVVVPLALLCLPLLCFAVAVVRFRRRRRRTRMTAGKKNSGCCIGGGDERPLMAGNRHRAALLQQYLEDQMELVGGGGEAEKKGDAMAAQGKKSEVLIGHEHQSLVKLGDRD